MLEVEEKIIVSCRDHVLVEEKLAEKGYELVWSGSEDDLYFSHPCRDLKERDEALRLRLSSSGGSMSYSLTWKGPKLPGPVKARREVSFNFAEDPWALVDILERLGFSVVARLHKERRIYSGGGVSVYLDKVSGLGCFVEVEAMGEGGEAVSLVEEVVSSLGLDRYPSTVKSYLELFLEKSSRQLSNTY